MSREATLAVVRECVADSLARDLTTVLPESRLIPDLGADSLDLLDIIFMLERRFGVKVREDEMDFLSRLDISSPKVMRGGFLTPEVVEKLGETLPALRGVPDPSRVTAGEIFGLISVETLCLLVERKLG